VTADDDAADGDSDRRPDHREPSLAELRALSKHATERLALYRRKMYIGRGEQRRLAELERIAAGAADRLKRAVGRARS
jgi:hypothetical protein